MTYGDATQVREMSGNPNTTDVSSTTMTQAIAYGDSLVNTFTGYDAWSSVNDPDQYTSIQTASNMFATSYVIKRYPKRSDEAKNLYASAIELCLEIRRGSSHGSISVSTNYHSWPANSNAGPYQSNVPLWTNSDGTTSDPGDV